MPNPTAPILDPAAREALAADPWFGPWVERAPPVALPRRASAFAALASTIVHQQLAGAAARTIHGRFVEALDGRVRPETVLAADPEALRAAGLSRSKLAAILDLASKAVDGTVPLRSLGRLDDEGVIDRLTRVRGIGEWSAQMFLMFRLGRPDVWPVGDLGVREGWRIIHDLEARPEARALHSAADHLRPWRSVAAWYCWRATEER